MIFQTVPQVAKEMGISPDKVLQWIARGEIAAVNIANRSGKRPRWRIAEDAKREFLKARSSPQCGQIV